MIWDELTTLEIAELNKNTPVVLTMAATEQHGPHLPLATDRMIGEYFAKMLDESIPQNVLILPAVSIGCSEHHMDFSGSLTLSHDTFINQVQDIIASVVAHEFKNVILLNSHGGNQAVGQVLVEKLGTKHNNINVILVTWWKLGGDALAALNDGGAMSTGHAGEFETSLMMLIAPHLVRTDKIEKGKHSETFKWAEGDMLSPPKISIYRSIKEMTSNGVFGDPGHASKEKGEQITELVINGLRNIISDLLKK